MASNSTGKHFRITTWGESHGKAIGVVIDGCPANLPLTEEDLHEELKWRRPGATPFTSPRKEEDRAEILSGTFEGKTTGTPISILIWNKDADSSKYSPEVIKPGHAAFTYLKKYGVFDYRGGGRASARETACRVAAGAVAKKLLKTQGIEVVAYIKEVGGIVAHPEDVSREAILKSPIFCPDPLAEKQICERIAEVKEEGDSLGGVVEMVAHVPAGLGDPIYEKLEACLGKAMLSIPASKGVEFGEGFAAARMRGSSHNDGYHVVDGQTRPLSNHAGGILGGISTGEPIVLRVAFKPTSSIKKPQRSVTLEGQTKDFVLAQGSRHDPCVALRAVSVVEAMGALQIADSLLSLLRFDLSRQHCLVKSEEGVKSTSCH